MRRNALLLTSVLLLGFVVTGLVLRPVAATDDSYKYLSNFADTLDLIQKNYVEETQLPRLIDGAYRGLLEELDPESYYLDAKQLKRYRENQAGDAARGRVGTGANVSKRHGYAFVLSVVPGSPADGKLATGDYIRVLDGASTREMNLFEIRDRLLGAPGSSVAMKVLRHDTLETEQVTLQRAATSAEPVRSSSAGDGLVVERLLRVEPGAFERLGKDLGAPGVQGAVLDLRGCALGSIADGARLADLFLDGGTLLEIKGKTGEATVKKALAGLAVERTAATDPRPRAVLSPAPAAGGKSGSDAPAEDEGASGDVYAYQATAAREGTVWRGPLVVLIDAGTAGAAEVAAAALKDNGRAAVIGQRSFGHAGIQDLIPFEDAALNLTVARALSPKGQSLLGKGIEPDEVVESAKETAAKDAAAKAGDGGAQASPSPGATATPAPGAGKPAADPVLDKALERLRADGREKKAA